MYSFVHTQITFDYHTHYDSILQLTEKKKSPYHYDALRSRFEDADTSLTNFEMLALIIGETNQDHYFPYSLIEAEREIMRLGNESLYVPMLEMCDSLLTIHPLNFTALIHKAFIEDQLGSLNAKLSEVKFMKLLDAIFTTGDGTYEAPIMVLGPADGQILITYVFGANIGTMGSGSDANGYFVDILEILKKGEEPAMMYFNIEHATKRMFEDDLLKEFEKAYKKDLKKKKKKEKKALKGE